MSQQSENMEPLDAPIDPDEMVDLITLEDEDGKSHCFEVLDNATIGEGEYFALIPHNDDPAELLDGSAELYVMRRHEEDGESYYDMVEDDDELAAAMQVFEARLADDYDLEFEEDEEDDE